MTNRVTDISGENTSLAFFPDGADEDRLSLLCGRASVITARGLITGAAAADLLEGMDHKNRRRILVKGDVMLTPAAMSAFEDLGVHLLGTERKASAADHAGKTAAAAWGAGGNTSGKITVLTGLKLTDLPEGVYELHALPLEKTGRRQVEVRAALEKCRKTYKMTTLCYIRKDDSYLMLYRNKKENDENEGKWIGIGGKIEEGESPEQCVLREVHEETGLTLLAYSFRGIITFVNDVWENEYMMLYEGTAFSGDLRAVCDEGELAWIPFEKIPDLPLWDGDRVFLQKLIRGDKDVSCRLEYHDDHLTSAS